jgi:hypothetical protein
VTTPLDIVNQALDFVAAQTQITSFAQVPIGPAAEVIYAPTVQLVLRQNNPDFARFQVPLVVSPSVPPYGWMFAYVYPADCLFARQVAPLPGTYNMFDPQPIRGLVYFANPGKLIATNLANAILVYTTSLVTENEWDALFTQSVVRQLANPLAMAVAGRPDFAKELLETAARYEQMAELDDESMARAM